MAGLLRQVRLGLPLVLAFAVPYILFSDSVGPIRQGIKKALSNGDAPEQQAAASSAPFDISKTDALLANTVETIPGLPQPLDVQAALRFEITPRWVLDRWPNVSTTRSEQQFDGLRVPLITGTGSFDLAGSLTYYFDQQQRLQRISFHGFTGDDRHVVSVVTRTFGMHPQNALGASVYVNSWNGKPTSGLLVKRMPVVRDTSAHGKFEVYLEINRPSDYFGLSSQFQNLLTTLTAASPSQTAAR